MESVWHYPRPPRLERTARRIRMVEGGVTLCDTTEALRVLETSHPPVYYIPPSALAMELLERSSSRQSFCEFKGVAGYWRFREGIAPTIPSGLRPSGIMGHPDVAWSYERPTARFAGLAGCLAFYASRVEECWVDEERVVAQEGDFYGGWITKDLVGPFKGGVGTRGW